MTSSLHVNFEDVAIRTKRMIQANEKKKEVLIKQDGLCPRDKYGCFSLKDTACNRTAAHRTTYQVAAPCLDARASRSNVSSVCWSLLSYCEGFCQGKTLGWSGSDLSVPGHREKCS